MKKIAINNLCFGYIGAPLCLKDVSFSIDKGETLTLLGGEGMGKTSLLKLLAGLENQYAGSVKIDGANLCDLPIEKRRISYLPSEPVMLENKSVEQNIKYLFEVENKEYFGVQKLAEILNKFDAKFMPGDRVKNLNLFEKRLLAIIRSFLKNSDILLIDDQLEGIGEENAKTIKNAINLLINEKMGSKTTILVANCKNMVEESHKYLYISYGKNYLFKTKEEIKKSPIDLFVYPYFDGVTKSLILEKQNNNYYLNDYKIEYEKEKKKKGERIELLDKKKLSLEHKESLDNIKLFEGETIKVVLAGFNEFEFVNLSDAQIDDGLKSGNYHIFEEGTGVKIL